MSQPIPLMILSDSVTATSGLGRITRELATRIAEQMPDEFRVATIGYGGAGSRHLPFPQYHVHDISNWVVRELPAAWEDFAGDQRGIVLAIWDASRLLWLSQPEQHCYDASLRAFLLNKPFDLWTYSAIDAEGPNGKLSVLLKRVLEGFDRVLAYSDWSARIISKTLADGNNQPIIQSLPHGIDTSVFKPKSLDKARAQFGKIMFGEEFSFTPEQLVVGIVATNQPRKDWGTAIEAASILANTYDTRLWIHTDVLERHWSMSALVHDFGLSGKVVLTNGRLTDRQMTYGYSACDVTWGIGLGEGFGYPIYESIACGIPCIHGNYGGGAEWLADAFKIEPQAYRYEGQFACKRPVYSAQQWVDTTLRLRNEGATLAEKLDWKNLWPKWQEWLRAGVKP